MNDRHAQLFVFVGAWLSLVAFMIGGSILLPAEKKLGDDSQALLYKIALNDTAPRPELPTPQGRMLIADIEQMQLSLYENGKLLKSFPILSKGRPGTPWETPTGSYVVQAKQELHYSSIGGTWMPYSMQFYGNFFIHGWPTYTNGNPVPIGYSGGCIRLSTNDAREVFEFTPSGVRLVVLGEARAKEFATSSRFYLRGEGMPPPISSKAFVVADIDSGKVLWERNALQSAKPEGLTLLATALTALETVNQYKLVRMSEVLMGHAVLRKYAIGSIDELPVGALIYPLFFDGNDTAAQVFAREHGSKQFVAYMNEKGEAIGMTDTIFSGAQSSSESTTTARDMMTLLRYVEARKHFLIDVSLAPNKSLTDEDGEERFHWINKSPWIISGDGTFRGGIADINPKGEGNAALLFELPVSEFGSRTIGFVIIDSQHVEKDIVELRRFVAEHFVYGIERVEPLFIREENEPTPSILNRVRGVLDLEQWMRNTRKETSDS